MLNLGPSKDHELKAEGALEAAQDPNSNVTSEAAQEVLAAEAKKAGAVSYNFDPNASPEEKAAKAKLDKDTSLRSKKPQHNSEIVTDIDDGSPDQYVLPPPAPEDEIETQVTSSKGTNGKVEVNDAYYIEKFGWAPGFYKEDDEDDYDADMQDHQTLLEGKLSEKFYGDWYHNAGIIAFACLTSWLVGWLGFSMMWLLILGAGCATYYRTSIRRVRRNYRDDINREMAKQRLETDSETLEWINSFMVKFWPIFAPNMAEGIVATVDAILSDATPGFLDSLRLRHFTLGTKPPRLEHVKTYPKTEEGIVLMDWKFSFTPKETTDMTQRQLRNAVNPKVILEIRVGKAMISKGMDVIVEDFAFSGLMRVKVKLQTTSPFVEKVEICFLERPEIDYVCKPIGGETLGFDINFIPGLETFIKEQIHANLQPMMYDPNVFPIEIAKMLAGTAIDEAIGILAVTVHGANGLRNPDKFSGAPDPYVALTINNRAVLAKTKTIHSTDSPRWNETHFITVSSFSDSLNMNVFDFNEFRKDKELGTTTFAMDQLETVREHDNISLDVMAGARKRGAISASIKFFPVLEGVKHEDGTVGDPPESNTGIARFNVVQGKDLDASKSMIGALNPYAVLLLNGKEIHTTDKKNRTNSPIFKDTGKEILITDRKTARLGVVVKDDRDFAADPIIGTYQIKLNDLLKAKEKGKDWFPLHDAKSGRVNLTIDWKPVALGAIGGSGGYVTPIGVMRIHFKGAKDVRNVETLGKSDPYARVLLAGMVKARTVTFQNNLNPDWDEVHYVPVHSNREMLTLEVMDEENLGKDRSLGMIELSTADYVHEGPDGEYEVHDEKVEKSDGLRLNGRGAPKGVLNYTVSFFPTLNVVDPEEEDEEAESEEAGEAEGRTSLESNGKPSIELKGRASMESTKSKRLSAAPSTNGEPPLSPTAPSTVMSEKPERPKIRISADDLSQYESGLVVFKIIEGTFARSDVQLEVLMDDMLFPSYVTQKARQRHVTFGEVGDAMVREIDVSKITLRLAEKKDDHGDVGEKHVIGKLQGPTLQTLQQCLYTPTELVLKGNDGVSKVTVSLRYIPVKMKLDPSESINNMGNLRVDVLDAAELPSADRNGYSDPYCRFKLNGKDIYKTKVQKKTLHPAWNEFFEVPIPSRTAADFKVDVYDWDFGDKADVLGGCPIDLTALEPFKPVEVSLPLDGKSGAIRLKMLFKPDYVIRSRQGSSTFSGTFAPAGKVIGAPVKGVGMVGGMVGGGVVKGTSFLRHGFKRGGSKATNDMDADGSAEPAITVNGSPVDTTPGTPSRAAPIAESSTPSSPARGRDASISSGVATAGFGGKAESGSAMITLLAASDFPTGTNVRVLFKQITSKGAKEFHKSKAVKNSSGTVTWSEGSELAKLNCTADTQIQIQVKDHSTFGSDDILGETLFMLDDQGTGGNEKTLKVGTGSVTLRSQFVASGPGSLHTGNGEAAGRPSTSAGGRPASIMDGSASPESKKIGRRSFLGSRRDVSRSGTPS